jgi:uracil-DNA glycosylase family 4
MKIPRPLADLTEEITHCRLCPRLVAWREQVSADPPKRFAGEEYWARPVPGFGDPAASVLVVGLAPASHGGNRTGRTFTGDRSGDFLFASLYRTGYANQPTSEKPGDGLALKDLYIGAVNRCAPPGDRPTRLEQDTCLPYLQREIGLLKRVRVMVPLGGIAWHGALRALRALGHEVPRPLPPFGHGVEVDIGPYRLLGSYHTSPHNTSTGRLTPKMLDGIFLRAQSLSKG